ncbi:K-like proteiny domain and K-like proteiny domain, type 1-containing protein [Aphelenchoides besseyi]|nr:K-like proteiny domain and K-like proteiny domain, type 1-containing protein [Aphelenchoides besseyi]KAI6192692.1 K-like proteiny domain and K-like proteiny domain, type 1-containing protein [Aphelenchoides besseyi]
MLANERMLQQHVDTGFGYPPHSGFTAPVPGDWYFIEKNADESSTGSGGQEYDDFADDFQMSALRAALNARSVTETVEVPSSEHVAEIVGRQGCKVKALRAKTNTYIKTPVRGEEPVFVVTGRSEDVFEAKREIECAAEHFTQIRASRRHSQGGTPVDGHVTAYVRVPLRVVGLVVGPKGATIKRIQQDTNTYIITPSRDREPIFEVTGLPQNVDAARREIEQHIFARTGNLPITDQSAAIGFDIKAAAAAASFSHSNANRPNYGYLAAGSHSNKRQTALHSMQQARNLIHQGHCREDSAMVAAGLAAYNSALKQYKEAEIAQTEAAKALGTFQSNTMTSTASAPNSTRGSSPTGPTNNSLYQHGYENWSNSSIATSLNDEGTMRASLNALIGMFSGSCGMSATKSAPNSRDEGIGESPTSSMGRLEDPYHLMSSIWDDLQSNSQRDKATV